MLQRHLEANVPVIPDFHSQPNVMIVTNNYINRIGRGARCEAELPRDLNCAG